MNIVNSFGVLSGLQPNKKKTKALWIGTSRKNKTDPLEFKCPKDLIKFLGAYLSHNAAGNDNNNLLHQNKENGNEAQYMAVTGPNALWKNLAREISRFVSVNLHCFRAFRSRNISSTDAKESICFSLKKKP